MPLALVDGAVAQLGERVVRNDEVSGSIPLSSTIRQLSFLPGSPAGLDGLPAAARPGHRQVRM
jgi:hypothetical protein